MRKKEPYLALASSKRVSQKQNQEYVSQSQFASCYFLTHVWWLRGEKSRFSCTQNTSSANSPSIKLKRKKKWRTWVFLAMNLSSFGLNKSVYNILSEYELCRKEGIYSLLFSRFRSFWTKDFFKAQKTTKFTNLYRNHWAYPTSCMHTNGSQGKCCFWSGFFETLTIKTAIMKTQLALLLPHTLKTILPWDKKKKLNDI